MRRSPVLGDYGLPVGGASRGGRASVRTKKSQGAKNVTTRSKINKGEKVRGVKFGKPTKHSSTKEVFKDSDVRRQAASRGMGRYLREGLNITERTRMRQFAKKFNADKGIMRQSSTMQERQAFLNNMKRSGAKVSDNMRQWVKMGGRTKPTIAEKRSVRKAASYGKESKKASINQNIKARQAQERDNVKEASDAKSQRVESVRKQMVEATKKSGGDERVRTRSPKVKGKKALGFDKQMDSQAAKSPSGTAKLAARKRLGKAQAGKQKAQKAMARTSSANRARKGGFSFYD